MLLTSFNVLTVDKFLCIFNHLVLVIVCLFGMKMFLSLHVIYILLLYVP